MFNVFPTNSHQIIEYLELEGITKFMESKFWLHTNNQNQIMSESIVQKCLELWQAWCHDQFPGEPVAVPDLPLSEEPFPNIQPEPHLSQLHDVLSSPVTGGQKEEVTSLLSAFPCEEAVGSHEVTPEHSLL